MSRGARFSVLRPTSVGRRDPATLWMRKSACSAHPLNSMSRRRLPHFHSDGSWLFVTWHLQGSVPQRLYPPPDKPSAAKAFVWMDRYLDTTRQGPMWLRRPEVATLVVDALRRGAAMEFYDLRAFVVMGNHVHVLIRARHPVSRVLQWIKGTTAREANSLLGRTGQPFWQRSPTITWSGTSANWSESQSITKTILSKQGWRLSRRSIDGRVPGQRTAN